MNSTHTAIQNSQGLGSAAPAPAPAAPALGATPAPAPVPRNTGPSGKLSWVNGTPFLKRYCASLRDRLFADDLIGKGKHGKKTAAAGHHQQQEEGLEEGLVGFVCDGSWMDIGCAGGGHTTAVLPGEEPFASRCSIVWKKFSLDELTAMAQEEEEEEEGEGEGTGDRKRKRPTAAAATAAAAEKKEKEKAEQQGKQSRQERQLSRSSRGDTSGQPQKKKGGQDEEGKQQPPLVAKKKTAVSGGAASFSACLTALLVMYDELVHCMAPSAAAAAAQPPNVSAAARLHASSSSIPSLSTAAEQEFPGVIFQQPHTPPGVLAAKPAVYGLVPKPPVASTTSFAVAPTPFAVAAVPLSAAVDKAVWGALCEGSRLKLDDVGVTVDCLITR